MAFEIKGINNLIKKLSNLENINTKQIVEKVADKVEKQIQNEASSFSQTESKYIGKSEVRQYGKSVFIDVGLKNDNAPFERWKGLYFGNFGFRQFYYGHDLGYMNTKHLLWFENAVNNISTTAKTEIKKELLEEIRRG